MPTKIGSPLSLNSLREGLCITKDDKPLFLIEAKSSKQDLDKSIEHFSKSLGNLPAIQVTREPDVFKRHAPHIFTVSANRFFGLLWR